MTPIGSNGTLHKDPYNYKEEKSDILTDEVPIFDFSVTSTGYTKRIKERG